MRRWSSTPSSKATTGREKTLVPFCTSGGSGFGRSLDRLPDSAPGATILEGLHVSGSSAADSGEEVAEWIAGLGL